MQRKFQTSRAGRGGFTLVEMLVAVALVLLMMTLFAEIFNLSTSAMTKMKGIAENDQRARIVANLLLADMDRRTFRDVVPFVPVTGGGVTVIPTDDQRRGYFSYSENHPDDDTDDTIRLTIDANLSKDGQGLGNLQLEPLFGRATEIGTLSANPNQPEGDDGQFSQANNAGMSRYAEVVWFLRAGKLYRRVMLIRDPYYPQDEFPVGTYPQPTSGNPPSTGSRLFTAAYTSGSGNFWRDFDYSAFFDTTAGQVEFLGPDALTIPQSGTSAGGFPVSLGVPHIRFGHHLNRQLGSPRERVGGAPLGAFTHEETSHLTFGYPGSNPMTNPLTRTDLTLEPSGEVTQYSATLSGDAGQRIGEDIVLSNVLSFDVKIWDPAAGVGPDGGPGIATVDDDNGDLDNSNATGADDVIERGWRNTDDGDWVDLGHSIANGMFRRNTSAGHANINNTTNGGMILPTGEDALAFENRFDTWYPFDNTVFATQPQYRPMHYVPSDFTAMAANLPGRGRNRWTTNQNYTVGTIVFPQDVSGFSAVDRGAAQQFRFAYRLMEKQTPTTVSSDPGAPLVVGDDQNNPTAMGGDGLPLWTLNSSGEYVETNLTGFLRWRAIPNLIPVKALRVTIRYLDVSSSQVRDLTLILPLRDEGQRLSPGSIFDNDGVSY